MNPIAQSEAQLARQVETYLSSHRYCTWFKVHGHPSQEKRLDYVIGWYGHHVELELKKPGKSKPDPYQANLIQVINRRGSVAFWADSLERVREVLEGLISE